MAFPNNTTAEEVNVAIDLGPDFDKQFRISILSIILLLSTVGNTLVLQKICNGELIWTIVDREWQYGDPMCKMFKFFQTFGLTSSTYLVVAIALDRVWAIVTPLTRHPSVGRLCLLTWVLAVLPCLPCIHLFDVILQPTEDGHLKSMCVSKFYSEKEVYGNQVRQIYFFLILTFVYIIPFILTISFYICILHTLFKQYFKLGQTEANTTRMSVRSSRNNGTGQNQELEIPDDAVDGLNQSTARASHRGLIPRARVKVFNLSLAYALTFLVSNMPYVAFEVIIALNKEYMMGPIMTAIMGILPSLNSALNPFMYLMFNSQLYCMQVFTAECCPLTSLLFMRLSAFTSRIPNSPARHQSSNTNQSIYLARINPELIGAPVHVSNNFENREEIEVLNPEQA